MRSRTTVNGNLITTTWTNVVFGYSSNDDGNIDAVVDYTPQRINNALFDGWQVTNGGPVKFRLGRPLDASISPNLLNLDGTLAYGYKNSWVGLNLQEFGWFDHDAYNALTWRDDAFTSLATSTYNRTNLSQVVDMIDGVNVQAIATWANIFSNTDLKIFAEGSKLKTEIHIGQIARNFAANNKPVGTDLYLVGLFKTDWINVPKIYRQGLIQNITDIDDNGEHGLELNDALDNLVAFMPIDTGYVIRPDGSTTERYALRKRIFTDATGVYLAVGIPEALFDAAPAGTLVLDPTFDSQPAEATGLDTWIYDTNPTTNYSTETKIAVFDSVGDRAGLIAWDISSISASATVSSATLSLWSNFASSNRTNEIHELLVSFDEGAATWNQRAGGTNWTSGGANGVGTDYNGTAEDTGTLSSIGGTKTDFDVSSAAQNSVGSTLYLIIRDGTNTGYGEWNSSNDSTASVRPRLVIVYTVSYTLVMGQGSFTTTGQSVGLTANRTLTMGQGSYTETGQDVNLIVNRAVALEQGSYTLTGQSVGLNANRTITAEQGSYTLTGQSVGLSVDRTVTLEQGSYTLSGQDVGLLRNYPLTIEQGSYTLTGQDLTPLVSRLLTIEQGSYTLTGQSVGLTATRLLTIEQGSYTLTGQDVILTYSGTTYSLTMGQGSYVLTGQNANLIVDRVLAMEQGSYTLAGQDTGLLISRSMALAQGSYTLTGQDVSLLAARLLTIEQGSYALTGQSLGLAVDRVLTASQGSYALTGQDVGLLAGRALALSQGSYSTTGYDVLLLTSFLLSLAQGSYTLTGQNVTLTYSGAYLPVGVVSLTFSLTSPSTGFNLIQPQATFGVKQPSVTFDL